MGSLWHPSLHSESPHLGRVVTSQNGQRSMPVTLVAHLELLERSQSSALGALVCLRVPAQAHLVCGCPPSTPGLGGCGKPLGPAYVLPNTPPGPQGPLLLTGKKGPAGLCSQRWGSWVRVVTSKGSQGFQTTSGEWSMVHLRVSGLSYCPPSSPGTLPLPPHPSQVPRMPLWP